MFLEGGLVSGGFGIVSKFYNSTFVSRLVVGVQVFLAVVEKEVFLVCDDDKIILTLFPGKFTSR